MTAAPTPNSLDLHLHERQAQAMFTPANEILFGGAAGGGKSYLLRAVLIFFALKVPGIQCYLFRRLFPDLVKNHLEGPQSFHVMLAPLILAGKVSIVKNEIRFWNGSRIYLCHLQHEKNKEQYRGQELHVLAFDELTHFTESMYRFLRSRCRLSEKLRADIPDDIKHLLPVTGRIICGSNPGGVGHGWVKRTFVTPGSWTIRRQTKKEGGKLRQYIPSKLEDNPSLSAEYADALEGMGDAALVRAMRDGDWNIVAGAMYGDVWREERHLIDPFPIPCDWDIWRGADDGFAAPACVEWLTQDPRTKTYYVIDEVYASGMLPDVMAERTLRTDSEIELLMPKNQRAFNTQELTGLLDSAAFNDMGLQNDVPRGNTLNQLGCKFQPVEKWPGSRAARAQMLHRLLAPNPLCPRKMPGLRFFRDRCPAICETLPALPRDPKNAECVDTNAEDHPFDALTYALQWSDTSMRLAKVSGT